MDSFIEIQQSLNASSKAPIKKKIKMKDVFSNSKEPNRIINMLSKYRQ